MAGLMAQADLLRTIRAGNAEIPRTLDAIANSEPEGQMTSYDKSAEVRLRPSRAGTNEHSQWLSVSAQLIAHESVDVQRELELVSKFCHPTWADQKDALARQAYNRRQQNYVDSLTRASRGEVKITPNAQRPLATAALANLNTRKAYVEFTQKQVDGLHTSVLSGEHLGNRLSGVNHWRTHCHEGWGLPFIRLEWLDCSNDPRKLWLEENLLISFFGHMIFRLRGHGPINMISHVKQFMESVNIPQPNFTRLATKMRLYNHGRAKAGSVRKARPYIKTPYVVQLSITYKRQMFSTEFPKSRRIRIGVKRCILTGAYRFAMRIVTLARGAAFDYKLHWCIKHFHRADPSVMTVKDGGHIIVRPTARKKPTENSKRPIPIAYDADCPLCFIHAYRDLRKLDPVREHAHRNHCLLRANERGHAPTATWFRKELTADMKKYFPEAAKSLDFTNHTVRRGAESCHLANYVDPVVIDQIAGNAHRSTRSLYSDSIMERILEAQRRMISATYTSMQDDVVLPNETNSEEELHEDEDDAERCELNGDTSSEEDTPVQTSSGTAPAAEGIRAFMDRAATANAPTAPPTAPEVAFVPPATSHPTAPQQPEATGQTLAAPTASILDTVNFSEYVGFANCHTTMCRRYQFKWYHPYPKCKFRAGHRCFYCGVAGHGGWACPNGGVNDTKMLQATFGIPIKSPNPKDWMEVTLS